MTKSGCRYGFICSANPTVLQLEGFPKMMSDAGLNEPEKIKQFDEQMAPFWSKIRDYMHEFHAKRDSKFDRTDFQINHIRSDEFIIYSFPRELDYFGDEVKKRLKLWQIDTPLSPDRVPEPYELPADFAALPGKTIYLSLGKALTDCNQYNKISITKSV